MLMALSCIHCRRNQRATSKHPIRILPLGDSLTEGGRDPWSHQSYRGYLYTLLVQAGFHVDFVGTQRRAPHGGGDPDHEGHGGFTIGPVDTRICPAYDLFSNLESYLSSKPDIVLLMIGINDLLTDDRRCVDRRSAPDRLEMLVHRIVELRPEAQLLLASLLPVEEAPNPWPEFDAMNQRAALIAATLPQVQFVDACRETGLASGDWSDGLHLSRSGAQKLAYVWFRRLKPLLETRRNAAVGD
jgi:lysophospholipase L1-like esterase